MSLPFFFEEQLPGDNTTFTLSEETSSHIIKVLRMEAGEQLMLTNGKGQLQTAELISIQKKSAEVKIINSTFSPESERKITIAISLIKNTGRFEWFLEKATEIGVFAIIPLISKRTERQHFRQERMNSIVVSAMLQSQQAWLPLLHQPANFKDVIKQSSYQNKYIAHCSDDEKKQLKNASMKGSVILLIGPEGDFTNEEIESARQNNFVSVTLGYTRLRTETAGIVAVTILNQQ